MSFLFDIDDDDDNYDDEDYVEIDDPEILDYIYTHGCDLETAIRELYGEGNV